MNEFGEQITFKQLFERHQLVVVPIIQRDYAQGRTLENEVRRDFLDALFTALTLPENHPSLPLNLDFIYGSEAKQSQVEFQPLDGQQRLTTLFLLHWYLAWRDECITKFRDQFRHENGQSRFSYSIRPSSSEFFDELLNFDPTQHPTELLNLISELIVNQPWYFRSWRLDPTIDSSLNMLDAIHSHSLARDGLYSRLTNDSKPVITFQLLNLQNFGLSDDLYIKMNARGKPLTALENFNARYEQHLKELFKESETKEIGDEKVSIAKYFSRRMDTAWADFFWEHRNPTTNLYDDVAIKLFETLAMISRNPEADSYASDIGRLRIERTKSTYSEFHKRNWIDREFSELLILLLDRWSEGTDSSNLLLESAYFDESAVLKNAMKGPSDFSYEEIVQFLGYTLYLKFNESKELDLSAFEAWMRIVSNLSSNYTYNRLDDVGRSIAALANLVPYSENIVDYFAFNKLEVSGFDERQIIEEHFKAQLILVNSEWAEIVHKAEVHGYFKGQIEFLFDFCGALRKWKEDSCSVESWGEAVHRVFQLKFEDYFAKAEIMFGPTGLKSFNNFEWQRALLSFGNYFLPSGRKNISFLTNPRGSQASWKRLLSGWHPSSSSTRRLLQQLFDHLDTGAAITIREQLYSIIEDASDVKPIWRKVLIETPEAFDYCKKHNIRKNCKNEIYLVQGIALNGYHAELFTFQLFQKAKDDFAAIEIAPLRLDENYEFVSGTSKEPGFRLIWVQGDQELEFKVEWHVNRINIVTQQTKFEFTATVIRKFQIAEEVKEFLLTASEFGEHDDKLIRNVRLENFFDVIHDFAQQLRSFAPPSSFRFWQPIIED